MPYGEAHTGFIPLIRIHTRGSPHGLHTVDSDSLGGLMNGNYHFLRLNVRYSLNLRKS